MAQRGEALLQSLEKRSKYVLRSQDNRGAVEKGSFGTIMIAEVQDRDGNSTGVEVAIKRQRRQDQERFEKEAIRERLVSASLRAIDSDNVMCLRDSYFESVGNERFQCLVYDLMDTDLHTWLKARKFMAVRKRVEVHSVDSRMLNSSASPIFPRKLLQGVLLLDVFTLLRCCAIPSSFPMVNGHINRGEC